MTLRIPAPATPLVSIVMVTHGGWRWARAALEAVVERTVEPFEVIVVDNGSTDVTAQELEQLEGARVILNEENRGFGPASNQGAAEARGRHLVFLNSDAIVGKGWLAPLLETLEEPGVAAVVPRLLNADGSLQEAGALLAQDGTVLTYGDGDDPQRPRYRFRRVVDFGAAACLLLRRADFAAVSGFDPIYAPAYYEDVDLCLRLASGGRAVVYEPRSTITHVRFGSGGLAHASTLYRRNRHRFLARWGDRLAGRPWSLATADERTRLAARDVHALPRILICDDGTHAPDGGTAASVIPALAAEWPRARISWLTGAFEPGAHAAEPWLRKGIELVDDDLRTWLEERRLFYDVVVVGLVADPRLPELIRATQPQARMQPLADLNGPAETVRATLARAGVA